MRLKRHFNRKMLAKGRQVCTHVDVQQYHRYWKPSQRVIDKGTAEGWLSLSRGKLVLHTAKDDADVVYDIIAPPGRYCCHCGEKLGNALEAQAHVAAEHAGKESPTARYPAGYAKHNFYLCELEGAADA